MRNFGGFWLGNDLQGHFAKQFRMREQEKYFFF